MLLPTDPIRLWHLPARASDVPRQRSAAQGMGDVAHHAAPAHDDAAGKIHLAPPLALHKLGVNWHLDPELASFGRHHPNGASVLGASLPPITEYDRQGLTAPLQNVDTENARVLGVGFEGDGGLALLALLGRPPIAARERPPSGVAGNGGRRGAPN